MQVDVNMAMATQIYFELKFWLPLVTAAGFLWKIFQGVSWLKGFKTDLLDMKVQVASQTSTIQDQLTLQTTAIVSELREIRQDFRMAMSPPPRLARARSAKKKIDTVTEHHV